MLCSPLRNYTLVVLFSNPEITVNFQGKLAMVLGGGVGD